MVIVLSGSTETRFYDTETSLTTTTTHGQTFKQ